MARMVCKSSIRILKTNGDTFPSMPADFRCVRNLSCAFRVSKRHGPASEKVAENKVSLYFRRAKLIDRLRVLVAQNPSAQAMTTALDRLEIDPFVVTQVLRNRMSPDTAIDLFNWLKTKPEFCQNRQVHHAIIKVFSDAGRIQEMQAMIDDISLGRYKGVSVSFMDLLRWNARAKNLQGALKVWDEMKRVFETSYPRKRPNAESFNILIDMFAQQDRYVEAADLFFEMIREGVLPNDRTYTVLIKHLVKMGKLNEGLEIFKRLPVLRVKHTSKQYYILAEAFSTTGSVDMVRLLVKEMQKDGILPTRALYSAVKVLREAGFVEEAEGIECDLLPDAKIGSMEALKLRQDCDDDEEEEDGADGDDLEQTTCSLKPWLNPNALASTLSEWTPASVSALEEANLVWNTRLVCKVLRAFKKADTALKFFHWVAYQPGFMHDIYTISRMTVMLAREGHAEAVDKLLRKAKSEGLNLSLTTMRLVIEAYGVSKNSDAALRVFHDIKAFGLKPNSVLYSSLIHTFVKCNQGYKAVDIVEEMMLAGICPDIQIFSGLMQCFAVRDDLKTMHLLFTWFTQSGGVPDAHAYRILIHAYCKNGRAAVALRLFEDMKSAHLMPDAATKSLLVNSLWTEGKLREAADVEEKCEQEGHELPKALPGSVWRASCADLMVICNIISKSFGTSKNCE